MEKQLEKHKIFPYIAWTTFVCFALFTAHLSLKLKETAVSYSSQTNHTVQALENTHNLDTDFE